MPHDEEEECLLLPNCAGLVAMDALDLQAKILDSSVPAPHTHRVLAKLRLARKALREADLALEGL